jgi:protein gp37
MARDSNIEWTHHTFNPWWGCVNVSPACDHCYAETFAKRFGTQWGKDTPRRFFGDRHWSEPVKWNRAAAAAGNRQRVFCASMADVFEDRRDLDEHRERLWRLIVTTPWLDWLLLTKRPWNILRLLPDEWGLTVPINVWLGTTAENQKWANQRIPALLQVPASVHFVSAEPLLGPIDLTHLDADRAGHREWCQVDSLTGRHTDMGRPCPDAPSRLDWVIVGGESGRQARPMEADWARTIRDQCVNAGVPFFFKQWGEHDAGLVKIGKHAAGRTLDGRLWNQVPHYADCRSTRPEDYVDQETQT